MSKFQERLNNLEVVFLPGLVCCQDSAIPFSFISLFQSQCSEVNHCRLKKKIKGEREEYIINKGTM